MSEQTDAWLNSSDSKDYFELLRMPSVGADPNHLRDCVQTATWLKKWLGKIGAEAELVLPGAVGAGDPALSVPVVVGERLSPEAGTTVLVYGHYDVQPADPLDAWQTPPFEPTVRDGRVFCRGAQDDKGQLFAFLCGVRAFLAEKPGAVNLKFVFEGQEESGSTGLMKLLEDRAFRQRISADVLLVCDTSAGAGLRPAIVAGLRGVCHMTVQLTGAPGDLHSGEYGGLAPNAAQAMCELVASLHNPDGAIAVAGFRDGIVPPTHDELAKAEEGLLPSDGSGDIDARFRAEIGVEPCGGQRGKTIAQRVCFEPTIEVNGIHAGYGGPGSKTIIPATAVAKLSMRLVPGQSPRAAYDAVRTHLKDHTPRGMTLSFPEEGGLSGAMRLPLASPIFRLAADVLAELDPRGAVFQWDGASIPVVSALKEASGAAPLLVGWGQAEDRIHAPNESYSVGQFEKAKRWAQAILSAL